MRNAAMLSALILTSLMAGPARAQGVLSSIIEENPSDLDYAFVDRPLVLPKGKLELSAQMRFTQVDPFDFTNLNLGASYGLSDRVELGFVTELGIDPDFEWSERFTPRGVISLLESGLLDAAVVAALPVNLGDGDTFPVLALGAPVRLKFGKLSVFGGHDLVRIALEDQISYFELNVGAAYQINDILAVRLDSNLISFVDFEGDSDSLVFGSDVVPLSATVLANLIGDLDFYATVAMPDIGEANNLVSVYGGVLLRLL